MFPQKKRPASAREAGLVKVKTFDQPAYHSKVAEAVNLRPSTKR